ncbi:MAG: hypothetical protein ACRESZ_03820 [Methylococcales bacterium]
MGKDLLAFLVWIIALDNQTVNGLKQRTVAEIITANWLEKSSEIGIGSLAAVFELGIGIKLAQ